MFTNTGLVLRLVIALIFLAAALLLLRKPVPRTGPALVAVGAGLLLVGSLYGLVVLRPFVGRYFDEQWATQIDIVDALSTLGMLVCAVGALWQAFHVKSGGPQV
jgi:formate hydrogenlyase subunit 3/multisubunit Na+/H+ antiporter MnhD subunit